MATITFRTDPETDRALAELIPGGAPPDRSAVIREAIKIAADVVRRRRLRQEALKLAGDAGDRAEVKAIQQDMEGLRAW